VEGRFVFADGAGVHVWPTCGFLAEYLREIGLGSDGPCAASLPAAPGASDGGDRAVKTWRGSQVFELGSGCGALAVVLARWGCSKVVATDASAKALALVEANADLHARAARPEGNIVVRRLDWRDLESCRALRRELGPFQAIIASDAVSASLPVGAMWRRPGAEALAAGAASSPEPLLDAAKELAKGGAEVIFAVANRAGDARCMARALLDRSDDIELLAAPREMMTKSGGISVTIFHFRYREASQALARPGAADHSG